MAAKRLDPDVRRAMIAQAAYRVGMRDGLIAAGNAEAVAAECEEETSVATVRLYFRTQGELMRSAAKRDEPGGPLREKLTELGL